MNIKARWFEIDKYHEACAHESSEKKLGPTGVLSWLDLCGDMEEAFTEIHGRYKYADPKQTI